MIMILKKRINLAIFFCLFIFSTPSFSAQEYPEWFLYPRKFDQIIVGYNYTGLSAREDAAYMHCAFRDCIVKGYLEFFETPQADGILKNSNYYYWFSQDSVADVQERLYRLEKFVFNVITGDYIAAFCQDSCSINFSPPLPRNNIPRPEWINHSYFKGSGYHYGVGMYTAQGRENDGWKTAEEQAIFSILTNIAVNIHKTSISEKSSAYPTDQAFEEILFMSVYFHLTDIEIIERYPDVKNQLFYVLVRIPESGIHSPIIKKAAPSEQIRKSVN